MRDGVRLFAVLFRTHFDGTLRRNGEHSPEPWKITEFECVPRECVADGPSSWNINKKFPLI